MAGELQRLDNTDLAVAQRFAQCLTATLNASRDPEALSDLIDYQLNKSSKSALRVLLTLKDIHSQDFFAKLHDCLLKSSTRLKALLLLAHMLNGEASWLYKTVDSPVFAALLQFLRSSDDVVLLSSILHVLSALIPLAPFHVSRHLPDLFEGFTHTATLKNTLVKFPRELFLGLDVAVFYFFLQLYALYPCKFLQYLKSRFGPTGEVQTYSEYIAPLFRYVLLHPNLITDLPNHETQRTRWSSKEPHDIATLALSLCTDPSLVSHAPPHNESRTSTGQAPPTQLINHLPQCDPSLCGRLDEIDVADIWSPLATLGSVTPSTSSHPPSRLGNSLTTTGTPISGGGVTTPSSDNSLQTTPLPHVTGSKKFSYSPTASVEGHDVLPPLDLSQRGSTGVSPGSSGRTSPTRSIGNTPRSFRHVVSRMFNKNNSTDNNHEDFTNISASEIEAIVENTLETSDNHLSTDGNDGIANTSMRLSPDPPMRLSPVPLTSGDSIPKSFTSTSLPNNSKGASMSTSLRLSPRSCPNDTVLMEARARLNSLRLPTASDSPPAGRPYSNSILTSIESLDTLTPLDEDDDRTSSLMLVQRTVDTTGTRKRRGSNIVGVVSSPLSPVTALDQYIQSGNVLHEGGLWNVPLTDLTGADWDHYGGCPHTEELRIKTSLAVMLHSQVLFERYQCQQHARRNRRLLSKARTTSKLESEVLALRCRLLQQDELIATLQSEQYSSSLSKGDANGSTRYNALLSQNKSLYHCNGELREELQRLKETVAKVKEQNRLLTKQIQECTSIEKENESLKNKLKEVPHLQNQMDVLLREQFVIEELYSQQKIAVTALKRENTELQQAKQMAKSLTVEKQACDAAVKTLKQEVSRLKGLLKEKEELKGIQEKQMMELQRNFERIHQDYNNKVQCLEEKYASIMNTNVALEEEILKLQGSKSKAEKS